MKIEQITVWKCANCNKYYTNKASAEICCSTPSEPKKICEDCGVELNSKCYYTVCDGCREKRRYSRCRKMTIEEYEEEFPDCMVVAGSDSYYYSVEDALENHCWDECSIPHYVYGTRKDFIEVNIEGSVENALSDAYEDAEFDNLDELYDFVSGWNKRNRLTIFEEAKIVIDIPEEIRKQYMR